jgi:hypothetical protein
MPPLAGQKAFEILITCQNSRNRIRIENHFLSSAVNPGRARAAAK